MANLARERACEIYPSDSPTALPKTLEELIAMKRTAYQLGYHEGYVQAKHDVIEKINTKW